MPGGFRPGWDGKPQRLFQGRCDENAHTYAVGIETHEGFVKAVTAQQEYADLFFSPDELIPYLASNAHLPVKG